MLYRFMLCFEFYMLLQDLIDTSIICAAFHSLVTVTGHRYSGIRAKANSGLLVTVQSTPNNALTASPRKAATMASKEETP